MLFRFSLLALLVFCACTVTRTHEYIAPTPVDLTDLDIQAIELYDARVLPVGHIASAEEVQVGAIFLADSIGAQRAIPLDSVAMLRGTRNHHNWALTASAVLIVAASLIGVIGNTLSSR